MTRIEGKAGDSNAVDLFALNPFDPVPRINSSAGVVGKPGDHFDLEAALCELAREEQPLACGFRIEPLSQQEQADRQASALPPHNPIHIVGVTVNDPNDLL